MTSDFSPRSQLIHFYFEKYIELISTSKRHLFHEGKKKVDETFCLNTQTRREVANFCCYQGGDTRLYADFAHELEQCNFISARF